MVSPFGFWTIPALNLSLCAIPKGGSTMNRQIVAKAAGVIVPEEGRCFLPWDQESDDALHKKGVTNLYSEETTNILVMRNPWSRSVSSFNDQIKRGHIRNNVSVPAFLDYLEHHADREFFHHNGLAFNKCAGKKGARFDHIIDLEDKASFALVSRLVPSYGALIETGWERCTGGEPRLYIPGSVSPHRNRDLNMKYRLCTKETISKVCSVYKKDYQLYASLGHPFECKCETQVSP